MPYRDRQVLRILPLSPTAGVVLSSLNAGPRQFLVPIPRPTRTRTYVFDGGADAGSIPDSSKNP